VIGIPLTRFHSTGDLELIGKTWYHKIIDPKRARMGAYRYPCRAHPDLGNLGQPPTAAVKRKGKEMGERSPAEANDRFGLDGLTSSTAFSEKETKQFLQDFRVRSIPKKLLVAPYDHEAFILKLV
jgi:hypothetical protein